MFYRFSKALFSATALISCCMLMSCSNSSGLDAPSSTTLHVTAVDGYLENARIWLDTTPNGRFDAQEPTGLTDAKGQVAITIPGEYVPSLSSFSVYALANADTTKDTGVLIPNDFLMNRPLASVDTTGRDVYTVLNPFATLAAAIASQNESLDFDQALQEVADELHMEKSAIAGDYFKKEPEEAAQKIEAVAGKMAREVLKTDDGAAPLPENEKITAFQLVSAEHILVAVAKKTLVIKKEEATKLLTRLGVTEYLTEVAIDEALSLNDQGGFDKEATKTALQKASLKLAAQDTDIARKHLAPLRKMAKDQKLQYTDYLQPEDFKAAIKLKENGDLDTEKTNTAIANLDTDGDGLTIEDEVASGSSTEKPNPLTIVLAAAHTPTENQAVTISPKAENAFGDVTWSITGDDKDRFSVNAKTGAITFAAQDFEAPADADKDNIYHVTLKATGKRRSKSLPLTFTVQNSPLKTLQVTALDGYLKDATIWLDSNSNQQWDAGEPKGITNGNGWMNVEIPAALNDSLATLTVYAFAEKGITTDSGKAILEDFRMDRRIGSADAAKADIQIVLNPFISLAQSMMREDSALDFDAAMERIAQELHIEKDALANDYIKNQPQETAVKIEAAAGLIAREILKSDAKTGVLSDADKVSLFHTVSAKYVLAQVAQDNLSLEKDVLISLLTRLGVTNLLSQVDIKNALRLDEENTLDVAATTSAIAVESLRLAGTDENFAKTHLSTLQKIAKSLSLQYTEHLQAKDFETAIQYKDDGSLNTTATNAAIADLDTDDDGLTIAEEVLLGTSPAESTPLAIVLAKTDYTTQENQSLLVTPTLENAHGNITWSVKGEDAPEFSVDAKTGGITFLAHDYETPKDLQKDNIYKVILCVADGYRTAEKALTYTVTDVPDTIIGPAADSVPENAPYEKIFSFLDGEGVTWNLTGADTAFFSLENGKLSFTPQDYENPNDAGYNNVYSIEITATKGALTGSKSFSLTVTDEDSVVAVADIFTTDVATAALREDGSVFTWGSYSSGGNPTYNGGQSSAADAPLTDIISITGSEAAFAALKSDGTVITWGDDYSGGDFDSGKGALDRVDKADLTDVISISASQNAFAALKENGDVLTWGRIDGDWDPSWDNDAIKEKLHNVVKVVSRPIGNNNAFAAIKKDGSVLSWGDSYILTGTENITSGLSDIISISCNDYGFIAVDKKGKGTVWGSIFCYTRPDAATAQKLTDIVDVATTSYAFAVLKKTGEVVSWGQTKYSGSQINTTGIDLTDIVAITSNWSAFAALKSDGSVVAWGDPDSGGSISDEVYLKLQDVVKIYGGPRGAAFAALKSDGSVVTWGRADSGADSSAVQKDLHDIKEIYPVSGAFIALKNDGTVVAWGSKYGGGDTSEVKEKLTDVTRIAYDQSSVAAIRKDGSVVTWGSIKSYERPVDKAAGLTGDTPTFMPVADTDQDGLTNHQERTIYHTSPGKWDTDGDGVSDQDEINNGTDPLKRNSLDANGNIYNGRPGAASTPDGWEDNDSNDNDPDGWRRHPAR